VPRKTTPKVKGGRVQKKNNWSETTDAVLLAGTSVAFERRRPGPAYRHLLRKQDLERFIALLPDWDELAVGLRLIVLDEGAYGFDGWHTTGMLGLCAWERDLWVDYHPRFVEEHRWLLDRLGVETVRRDKTCVIVRWTEATAKAYLLLHVFLHELGHHHDRMTTRSRAAAARGETYAEAYATRYVDRIWESYEAEFGW
jgi:hypothetical protein